MDFRVLKGFAVGEGRKLQFSAEFFNLFNFKNVVYSDDSSLTNFNLIYGTTMGTPRAEFMRLRLASGAYDPRNVQVGTPLQMQFGLRFIF